MRAFFQFGSGQLRGVTAFAAFIICTVLLAVFGYALINRFGVREVNVADVQKNERAEPNLSSPTPTPVALITSTPPVNPAEQPASKASNNDSKIITKPAPAAAKPVIHQDRLIASPPLQHQVVKPVKSSSAPIAPLRPAELASESVDDLEDNSLRLTDLLDDVTPSI